MKKYTESYPSYLIQETIFQLGRIDVSYEIFSND